MKIFIVFFNIKTKSAILFLFIISYCQSSFAVESYITASITFSNVASDNSVTANSISMPQSSATFASGNVWTDKELYSFDFDSTCLTMSGDLIWTYTYGNGTAKLTADMPASWITASTVGTTFSRVARGGDYVRNITFTSNTLRVVNSCDTAKSFTIYRTLDFGENHWNLTISGSSIPAANTCTVLFPSGNTLDLGSISAADINQNYNSLLSSYAATTNIQVSCTTATTYLLSFSSANTIDSGGCLTDSSTTHNLSFCLSANSNDLDFSSSSTPSITLTGSGEQDVSLTVTPRSLTTNATAGAYSSTVTVTVTAE